MPVNANKSGGRLLAVIEEIARSQPVGVRILARHMQIEKSAVQRAVTTLAEAGWIHNPSGPGGGWELTGRILHVAQTAHGSNSLRQRIRPLLNALRDQTGETAYLAIPDAGGLVVTEVAESHRSLRLVVPVGAALSLPESAAGLAILAQLGEDDRSTLLGGPVSPALDEAIRRSIDAGHSVLDDGGSDSAVSIASPVFDTSGRPVGALVLYAVGARTPADEQVRLGQLLEKAVRNLSSTGHSELSMIDLRNAIGSFG